MAEAQWADWLSSINQAWLGIAIILALWRWRQEDQKFWDILGYIQGSRSAWVIEDLLKTK